MDLRHALWSCHVVQTMIIRVAITHMAKSMITVDALCTSPLRVSTVIPRKVTTTLIVSLWVLLDCDIRIPQLSVLLSICFLELFGVFLFETGTLG